MIQINKDWRMSADEMCITLEKRSFVKVKKDGKETNEIKEVWSNGGYFGNYKQALNWVVRNEIQNCETLELIVGKVTYLEKLINNLNI